jgi:hypothetical protein
MASINIELSYKNVKDCIQTLSQQGEAFDVEISTYTTKIIQGDTKYTFAKNSHSDSMFIAYNKIKSDVLIHLELNGKPKVNLSNLLYFDTNITKPESHKIVHNWDIKSAYLNALFIKGIISKETYEYCSQLEKKERLVSVGMLASRAEIFHYNENGEIEATSTRKNPLSDYFFAAVEYTGNAMNYLRKNVLPPEIFIFYWVDGIYARDAKNIELLDKYVNFELNKNFGFELSYEKLRGLVCSETAEDWNLSYYKGIKKKTFSFPKNKAEIELKRKILELNKPKI